VRSSRTTATLEQKPRDLDTEGEGEAQHRRGAPMAARRPRPASTSSSTAAPSALDAFTAAVVDHAIEHGRVLGREWALSSDIASLTRFLSERDRRDASHQFRRQHRSLKECIEAVSKAHPALVSFNASRNVVVVQRPAWDGNPPESPLTNGGMEGLRDALDRIEAERTELARKAERLSLAAERRRAGGVWSPATHRQYGPRFRAVVTTVLGVNLRAGWGLTGDCVLGVCSFL